MSGWIKMHRSLLEWEWYDDMNVTRLFFHCILKANHKDKKYRGKMVLRGSFLTSRELLAEETGLSISQVRTALNKLKLTNDVTSVMTSKGSSVTVVNYGKYQARDQQDDQPIARPVTSQSQTSDKPIATNKNDKKERIIKKSASALCETAPPQVPFSDSNSTSISADGEPMQSTQMTMQQLMNKVNGLKPEWSRPAAWSYAEKRELADGVAQQLLELTEEDWAGLKRYLNTPLASSKGFWQPNNRTRFTSTFSDVFAGFLRWQEKNPNYKQGATPAHHDSSHVDF